MIFYVDEASYTGILVQLHTVHSVNQSRQLRQICLDPQPVSCRDIFDQNGCFVKFLIMC